MAGAFGGGGGAETDLRLAGFGAGGAGGLFSGAMSLTLPLLPGFRISRRGEFFGVRKLRFGRATDSRLHAAERRFQDRKRDAPGEVEHGGAGKAELGRQFVRLVNARAGIGNVRVIPVLFDADGCHRDFGKQKGRLGGYAMPNRPLERFRRPRIVGRSGRTPAEPYPPADEENLFPPPAPSTHRKTVYTPPPAHPIPYLGGVWGLGGFLFQIENQI